MLKGENRKFILSIGDEGAILTLTRGKQMIKRLFVTSPSSSEFVSFMASAPNAPLYILVDVVDQAYVQQTLPPVSSFNVSKLVQRKLDKDFDAGDLKAAISLGREKTGRKDWNYLFVSVRNIPPFSDWIDAVSDLSNKFAGIYLLPIEAMNYLKDLKKLTKGKQTGREAEWQIMVSHNRVGGFRQVVFRNGQIIFTRIAQPIGGQTADVVSGNIEQETLNTIEYIRRLGFDDESGLDLYVIASAEVKEVLELTSIPSANPIILTPYEIAQGLGLNSAAEERDRFGDVITAVQFITTKKHGFRLDTEYTKKISKVLGIRKVMRFVAGLCVLGVLGFTGQSIIAASSLEGSLEKAKTERKAIEKEKKKAEFLRVEFEEDTSIIKEVAKANTLLVKDRYMVLEILKKFSDIGGFDTQITNISASITEQVSDTNVISVSLDVDFRAASSDLAQLLDDLDLYVETVTKQFEGYSVGFTGLPNESDISLDLDKEVALKISIDGPGESEKETQKRGRR